MNKFAYRVYHQYNGPSKCDPLRSLKSAEDIAYALTRFPAELPYALDDEAARINHRPWWQDNPDSIRVEIETTLDEAETDDAVKRCLNGLDLFGQKLPHALCAPAALTHRPLAAA